MKNLIVILSICTVLSGCENGTGPGGAISSGTLSGKVFVMDDEENYITPGNVLISLKGKGDSALSDENGFWKIPGVPAGVYDISFSRPGCFAYEIKQFQFSGNGTYAVYDVALSKLPPIQVSSINVWNEENKVVRIEGELSSYTQRYRKVEVMFSKEPIIIKPEMSFDYSEHYFIGENKREFSFSFTMSEYVKQSYGLKTGDKLYAVGFLYPYYNYNPMTRKFEVYTQGINFSNIDTLIVQ